MTVTRPEVPVRVITQADVRASIRRAKKSLVDAANEVVWQIEMEAWRTLGYPSWTAMREAEYGGVAFMVPSKDRPELVARIRAKGITQREAAATTGVTEQTIYNDERKARDPKYLGRHQAEGDVIDAEVIEDDEPQVDTKTGEVSADYVTDQADLDAAPELPDEGAPTPHDSGDAEPSEGEGLSVPSPSPRSVTGQGREPQTPRRAPLPDAFWRATYDLTKVTERLGRLTQDDRFPQNAEKVATANRSDLLRASDLLHQVIDSIPEI